MSLCSLLCNDGLLYRKREVMKAMCNASVTWRAGVHALDVRGEIVCVAIAAGVVEEFTCILLSIVIEA